MTRDELITTEPPSPEDAPTVEEKPECVAHRWRVSLRTYGQSVRQVCIDCREERLLPANHVCVFWPMENWRWESCWVCGRQQEKSCAPARWLCQDEETL